VVFIHGAGGSIATWNYQVQDFSEHFNLLLLDLRDHGESKFDHGTSKYNFSIISEDILEVTDHLGIKSCWFVSLSFGSVLLQALSMRRPGLVSGAVMAGAIFKADLLIRTFVYSARFMNYFLSYSTMYSLFSYLLMPGDDHQLARRVYQRQAAKLTPHEYMKWVGLYGEFFRLLKKFWKQDMTFPVLVVMGREDYIFLPRARSFSENRTNVELLEVRGAGHICNIDMPDIFNQSAIRFIQRFLVSADISANPPSKPVPENA
jgi:pimeloyl-ACP methyl ester carboxylesterase